MSKMKTKVAASLQSTARFQALLILLRCEKDGAYANLLVKEAPVKKEDRALLAELVYGVLSRRYTLDYQLAPFIQGKKVDLWVRLLLLLALYQILFLDRVPQHAIVDESVKIAKQAGNVGVSKFVNGVLRTFLRSSHPKVSDLSDPLERLCVQYSISKPLAQLLLKQYGWETTEALLASLIEASKVSARLCVDVGARSALLEQLRQEGYEVEASAISPYGIVGRQGYLAGSTPFQKGALTIQDESSMLVAPALQVEPQHQVLDACAAPGGKTTHIAQFLSAKAGGKVTALDIHAHKCQLIEENAQRLGLEVCIETKTLDARKVDTAFADESFDRILVDAPCSGLGLMRRKPDIKYRKSLDDLQKLTSIQKEILNACAPKLKVGGLLVYSTCTINKDENEAVVQHFLNTHPNFTCVPVVGQEQVSQSIVPEGIVILPQQYGTDGFFISCLKKMK